MPANTIFLVLRYGKYEDKGDISLVQDIDVYLTLKDLQRDYNYSYSKVKHLSSGTRDTKKKDSIFYLREIFTVKLCRLHYYHPIIVDKLFEFFKVRV